MATTDAPKGPAEDTETLKKEWLDRLAALVGSVEGWAQEYGWSTRRIEKKMRDSQIGPYKAPALILQEETTRVLLEPIARSAPGAEGVVDLYRMPAYDDIASLYFSDGEWHVHYMSPGDPVAATPREAEPEPFSKETFRKVIGAMKENDE
jgi:hypothetical protein